MAIPAGDLQIYYWSNYFNMSELTIYMYHHVRDTEKTEFPKIHAISTQRFKNQVEKIQKEYEIIPLFDVLSAIEGKSTLPKKSCVLSFDDGLKDHYQNVFPILKERGLSGAFFGVTITLEGKVPDVNKLQFLLAKVGTDLIVSEFNNFLENKSSDIRNKYKIKDDEKIDPRYRFDNILTANLKAMMQILPQEIKSIFLNQIFEKFLGDEKKFAKELYLNEDEWREMDSAGMVIGSHTHTHPRLDRLIAEKAEVELKKSKEILEKVLGKRIGAISYPYGNYNDETLAIIQKLGYSIALGTEVGINEGKSDRWALKRLNANSI